MSFRQSPLRGSVLATTVLAVVLCFVPLFNIWGVESALLCSALLPFWVIPSMAADTTRRKNQGAHVSELLSHALLHGFGIAAIPTVLIGLNQLRVGACEPSLGLAFMLFGAWPSVVLASLVGATVALFVKERAARVGLLIPAGALFLGVYEFWSTPAVFVYSHLLGWFPGTLYDVGRAFPVALGTFRVVTVLWCIVFGATIMAFGVRKQRWAPLLVLLAGGLAGLAFQQGPALGHRTTADAIDEALGGTRRGPGCVVHYPRELDRDSARRLLLDCEFRVARANSLLGVEQDAPIHAYFYRSPEEKQRWMGAGHTFIAKPWRNEVHLQLRPWPHPVLGHEVIHAVAAQAADGPFRVSGTWGGFFPNAMLIEGIAVGLDWPQSDGLTPDGWSKAMRELDVLPRAFDLQDLGFLRFDSRRAYAAAGSLTRFFYERHGAEALRQAHRAGRFDVVEDLEALEEAWHAHLDALELPPGALGVAELRFSRSSIFERVCPHQLARLRATLGANLGGGDDASARLSCREILDIEPGALDARTALVGIESRLGNRDEASRRLAQLAGAPPQLRARAQESMADATWRRGRHAEAIRMYRQLLAEPQTAGERRLREVKLLGLLSPPPARDRVRQLFVDMAPRAPTTAEIVDLARDLAELRDDGLGHYLIGRQLMAAGNYERASQRFEIARLRGLPTEALAREATRNLAIARAGHGDLQRARDLWRGALRDPALRHEAQEWLERISFLRSR